jgi:hypothetical protein
MTKTRRRAAFVFLVPVLMLLVTACDREGGSLAGVPAEYLSFCNDAIKAEDVASDPANPSGPAESIALHDKALRRAPDDIKTEFARLVPRVRQALESEAPDEIFREPNFRKLEDEVDRWVIDNCGVATEEIRALEYRFEDVPHPVWEGRFAVRLVNEGKEIHEIAVVRVNDGVTDSAADLLALPLEQVFQKVAFVDSAAAVGNQSDNEVFDLEAGRYLFACFVPVGTTETTEGTGPPHATRGMYNELTVRPSV